MATYSVRMLIATLQDIQENGFSTLSDEELKGVIESLDRAAELPLEPSTPIREALCKCEKPSHNFQEVAINWCFACQKPLHS